MATGFTETVTPDSVNIWGVNEEPGPEYIGNGEYLAARPGQKPFTLEYVPQQTY
jgi:hypothetical protein